MMNLYSTIWRCIIVFLIFSLKHCPLLPAGCYHFNSLGHLTVEPAPLFRLGSDLKVYCHITKCEPRSKISLDVNGRAVVLWTRVNCTTGIFNLSNVRAPRSIVLCKLNKDDDERSLIVNGLDLFGGLPPDKPKNIICETSRSSGYINCTWERGQETHMPTTYNVSLKRENGTQILLHQIQDEGKITISRAGTIEENTKYQLIITAYNHFGTSESDPFILSVKDIVIPETPLITLLEFGNNSRTATLHWKATVSSEHLKSSVRLRTDTGSWEEALTTEFKDSLILVDGLKPLIEYEFQMQTCDFISVLNCTDTPKSGSRRRPLCSEWSPSVWGRSPGKGPSQQLHVWRMSGSQAINGQQMVTVLWKPPSRDDYSGEVQRYKIFLGGDHKQEATCLAASSQCSVLVPEELQALSISAITSYGASPPADLLLKNSGDPGPVLKELTPAGNGSSVFVAWSWPETQNCPACGEMLHFVLEWTSVPSGELQWQKLEKDQSNTLITGLSAGVRYNVALYAVTTRGVSAPSSGLIYSKEQKPASAPNMSVLIHMVSRILIQWDELPVEQQRGFITNYTIYLETLDTSGTKLKVTVPGSGPRQRWLDCPEAALALQLSASTSAGEGQLGHRITSQPSVPAVGLVIVLVFIVTLFVAIIANLLCWSCVRKRIKQKCVSCGPAWFHENLPKPGNSNAIKLLEQDGSELSLSPTYSDPPLSPINLISEDERDDVYPTVQIDAPQASSGQTAAATPLLMSYPGTMLDHVSYKPQGALLGASEEEAMDTEEEQRDVDEEEEEEEERCSSIFRGLQGGFLSSVEVDVSDLPPGLTLSSVNGLLWPKTPETTSVLGTENDVEADSPSLDPQAGEIMTPGTEDTRLSQYTLETVLTGGYFPQLAVVSSTTLCDTQM